MSCIFVPVCGMTFSAQEINYVLSAGYCKSIWPHVIKSRSQSILMFATHQLQCSTPKDQEHLATYFVIPIDVITLVIQRPWASQKQFISIFLGPADSIVSQLPALWH